MAGVTLTAFVDNIASSSGDIVSRNLFNPEATATSFAEINGLLDNTNFTVIGAELWDIESVHLQSETFNDAKMVGATANLDYFGTGIFLGWNIGTDTSLGGATPVIDTRYQSIPGAGISFYVPYDDVVSIFTWTIAVANNGVDGVGPVTQVGIHFVIDGQLPGTLDDDGRSMTAAIEATTTTRYGQDRDREYSGHYTSTSLSKGWHTAGLVIGSSSGHVRVRCRSMRYIYLA